jgi:inorganic phosphate transporter, PiT family
MVAVSWIFFHRPPYAVDQWFRRLQLPSSALYRIEHGSNDAQKSMGLIWLMLISAARRLTHAHGTSQLY